MFRSLCGICSCGVSLVVLDKVQPQGLDTETSETGNKHFPKRGNIQSQSRHFLVMF